MGPIEGHEPVKPAKLPDQFVPRPEVKMIGVGQDALNSQCCQVIDTPYFVPVATLASVRALGSDDLAALGVQCVLANTYHLHLKPGDELIKKLGGLHRFMSFDRPIFSDSGGFQAFSWGAEERTT